MTFIFNEQQFRGVLHQGNVFYISDFRFEDNSIRDKYAVVLSKNTHQSEFLLVLSTSKIQRYNDIPFLKSRIPFCEIIQPGNLFSQETLLDTSELRSLSFNLLFDYHKTNEIRFKGKLTENILRSVLGKIKNNPAIEDYKKELIL